MINNVRLRNYFHTNTINTEDINGANMLHDPMFIFSHCRRIENTQKNSRFKIINLLSKQSHSSVEMKQGILTRNELRTMNKISYGLSQRRIAEQLKVSEKTISSQKIDALKK